MRVQRCFSFIDLSGFTALTESEGDERAVRVLTTFRQLVRDICSRRGVRIAKWLGDGAMLVGVENGPVVAAALELQLAAAGSDSITVSCGITAGEVILLEGDDYIGHCVNVAARLCDMAAGGEVLADSGALTGLPPWGAVLDREERAIRGLEQPVTAARLGLRLLEGTVVDDPVCGIPLTREVAPEQLRDRVGNEVWFCSDSCRDTWERRPAPAEDDQGSLRSPLIG